MNDRLSTSRPREITVMKEAIQSEFHGKVALITGGSRGIGFAIAKSLAQQGARVAITGRDRDRLALAAKDLGTVLTVPGDAGDLAAIRTTVSHVADRLGPLDILVNNAAVADGVGPIKECDYRQAEELLRINTIAPLVYTQEAAARGLTQNQGVVVNIASIAAFRGAGAMPMYAVTKAALVRLTQITARDYAPDVRINAVAPGLVETEFAADLLATASGSNPHGYPLGRVGKPRDVVDAVEFLLSAKAKWITGETLVLDGGRLQGPAR